jgi:hypothetical protein
LIGHKNYLQPVDMLLNGIHDLAGLQKAETLITDSALGLVCIRVTVYAEEQEYRFSVEDIGGRRSRVSIELTGDGPDTQRLIDHEFALLDYVLIDRAKIELEKIEEKDRQILASNSVCPKEG